MPASAEPSLRRATMRYASWVTERPDPTRALNNWGKDLSDEPDVPAVPEADSDWLTSIVGEPAPAVDIVKRVPRDKHRCKLPGWRARRRLNLGIGSIVQCRDCGKNWLWQEHDMMGKWWFHVNTTPPSKDASTLSP